MVSMTYGRTDKERHMGKEQDVKTSTYLLRKASPESVADISTPPFFHHQSTNLIFPVTGRNVFRVRVEEIRASMVVTVRRRLPLAGLTIARRLRSVGNRRRRRRRRRSVEENICTKAFNQPFQASQPCEQLRVRRPPRLAPCSPGSGEDAFDPSLDAVRTWLRLAAAHFSSATGEAAALVQWGMRVLRCGTHVGIRLRTEDRRRSKGVDRAAMGLR